MHADLSTPEAALAALEDAYNRKDIEAAVAAKDFVLEAREMLISLKAFSSSPDPEVLKQTADVLELSFRKHMEVQGFPDFTRVRCKVVSKKELRDDLVEMVEECLFPDGGKSHQTMHAAKNESGWHIIVLPPSRWAQ
ncbi:MAG TPA: hypothetical protein VKL40_11230 [Candidatus Angelobacter sp.]|nr:hypothetical protein [Candidatus Angelobacter sp.]